MGYRGTYKQKRVTKLAPDAVIRINGKMTIDICPNPKCNSRVDISKYVTSLSTSLANNTTIGNAQFNIAMPRHGDNGIYMVRGGKVHGINLMDEVEIFMKARFISSDKTYKYHKVFWGVIVNIGESYGSGEQGISVNCESMLKWLQLMKTNEHPSIMALADTKEKLDLKTLFWSGKTYANKNPYQIIYSLVNITMLNMVIPSVLDTEKGTIDIGNEKIQKKVAIGKGSFPAAKDIDLLKKWNNKFASIKSSLKMFGCSEEDFVTISDSNQAEKQTTNNKHLDASGTKEGPIQINYNTRALMDFRPFIKKDQDTEMDLVSNSYKNNLEIASEVKVYTGFEFYLDTTGDIIFKPPFWNLDTSENEVFRLKDEDIISWDFKDSEESVVTRIEVKGSHLQSVNVDSHLTPTGIFTNYNLARQFGMRTEPIYMKYFTTPSMCYAHAISEMDRINANKYKGSITIVGRPEIRLGYPVYIESRDIFGYVENINHNFTFGGPFTTSLQLSAIRKKYIGEDSMSDGYGLTKTGDSYRSYNYKGDPRILIYEGEDVTDFIQLIKERFGDKAAESFKISAKPKATTGSKKAGDAITVKHGGQLKTNRAGVYKEYPLSSPKAQELLAALDMAKNAESKDTYLDFLERAIPVSDEDGYELIGIFENGRSLYLDRNGVIKKRGSSFSQILQNASVKATQGRTNIIVPGHTEINIEPTSNSDVKDDPGVDKGSNTAKSVRDYYKDKAISLNKLRPTDDTSSTRGCSCQPSDLTGLSTRDRLGTQSKQRVMSKVSINNKK